MLSEDSQLAATPDWTGDGTAGPPGTADRVVVARVVLVGLVVVGAGVGVGVTAGAVGKGPVHWTQYSLFATRLEQSTPGFIAMK
jgi:hypothetical protein